MGVGGDGGAGGMAFAQGASSGGIGVRATGGNGGNGGNGSTGGLGGVGGEAVALGTSAVSIDGANGANGASTGFGGNQSPSFSPLGFAGAGAMDPTTNPGTGPAEHDGDAAGGESPRSALSTSAPFPLMGSEAGSGSSGTSGQAGAGGAGIHFAGAPGDVLSVQNDGGIFGGEGDASGAGVRIDGGSASVTNTATGVISSPSAAALVSTSADGGVDVFNYGTITSQTSAVSFAGSSGAANSVTLYGGSTTTGALEFNDLSGNETLTFSGLVAGNFNNTITGLHVLAAVDSSAVTMNSATGYAMANGTVDVDATSMITVAGALRDGSSATAISKTGAGTLTLSGTNTYTGPTVVSSGQLLVNGSLAPASAVSVSSGATLRGTGAIGGSVTVHGTLSPGAIVESLAVGSVSFEAGSEFVYEFSSAASLFNAADLLVVAGDLDIAAGTALALFDLSHAPVAFTPGTILTLVNYGGAWDGGVFSLNGIPLGQGSEFTFGDTVWEIDYTSTVGGVNFQADQTEVRFVNITAVPEPSTFALLGIGALACFFASARKRNRT
jgi:autotransporter-associated beta strand protein